MVELRAQSVDPMPGPAATRRLRRAAVTACGVLRLPMGHALTVYEDTVEHAVERMLPAPLGAAGMPDLPLGGGRPHDARAPPEEPDRRYFV